MYKDKECIVCHKMFSPKSGINKTCPGFCTDELRRFRERERDKKSRSEVEKQCSLCGKSFNTRDSKKKYCGSSICEEKRVKFNARAIEVKRAGKRSDYTSPRYYANRERFLKEKRDKYRLDRPDVEVKDGWSTVRLTRDKVEAFFRDFGYKLISESYKSNHDKLSVVCPKGHTWKVAFHNFKEGNQRCAVCQRHIICSAPEREIYGYLNGNNPDLEVTIHEKDVISGELDLYFPDQKTAVEYCGLYWHGERSGKERDYHFNKYRECFTKGIRLFTVFEDEYLGRPLVCLSRIESALGLTTSRIFARKCVVNKIDSRYAAEFFEQTHTQGRPTAAPHSYGLYYNDVLVQAMSFGSPVRSYGKFDKDIIELNRLSSLPGVVVVGGPSRLFSAAKPDMLSLGYKRVVSYADMRWANPFSSIYEKLGFDLVAEKKYDYYFCKGQKRYSAQRLHKTEDERLTGETLWELRQAQGFDRIWDCGRRTYIYEL